MSFGSAGGAGDIGSPIFLGITKNAPQTSGVQRPDFLDTFLNSSRLFIVDGFRKKEALILLERPDRIFNSLFFLAQQLQFGHGPLYEEKSWLLHLSFNSGKPGFELDWPQANGLSRFDRQSKHGSGQSGAARLSKT